MKVQRVDRDSDAEDAGIRLGDDLVEIDGHTIGDGIDVAHAVGWTDDETVDFVLVRSGDRISVRLPAVHPDELGIALEPDTLRTCGNRCKFCFIDQLPRGLRSSLYVKDEDYRLSFSCGNYVTLTNLSDADYDRILTQRLSPLYVSVHATDDGVRRELLGNPNAPPILPSLRRLVDGDIQLHTQIVVCPGTNDGAVLDRTLRELTALGHGLASVAVVPVGLTAHRAGLPKITPVTAEAAREIVAAVEGWQATMLDQRAEPVLHAADELYLLAGLELPQCDAYGEFPQLENGVGLLRWFERDVIESARRLQNADTRGAHITVLTGTLAAPFLRAALGTAFGAVEGLDLTVLPVANHLLGETVTVAGLLAGADIAAAIRDARTSDLFVLPGEAFNADGLTLDGSTIADIRGSAGTEHIEVSGDLVTTVERLLQNRGTTAQGVPPADGQTNTCTEAS